MNSVLIVGLDRKARQRLASLIEQDGLTTRTAGTVKSAAAVMQEYAVAAVLIDCGIDGANGLQALATLQLSPKQVVAFMTDEVDGPLAEALGVDDTVRFFILPRAPEREDMAETLRAIKRTIREREEKHAVKGKSFESMLGNCPQMLEVYSMIAKVAPTDASVLICGESGTGKELVARAIHERSERSKESFVAVNCGAIAENLIESELFGHEKGAFTGADKARAGYFEQAHGGTLFLDEITEMPLEVQVRFLRVLETGTLRRLGAEKDTHVNARVVAATNRDPQQAVDQGQFREDLMYRLAVFPVSLPPLRERGDDVVLLASHFLSQHNKQGKTEKRLSGLARKRLKQYDWPGNVRQLRNMVQRAYILEDAEINLKSLEDLLNESEGNPGPVLSPDAVVQQPMTAVAGAPDNPGHTDEDSDTIVKVQIGTSIDEAEKQLILKTLDELDGNKSEAAKVLGISLKTLYNRLNDYEE